MRYQQPNLSNLRRVAVVQWLRQKTHDEGVLGSNPHYGDHFSGTIHLDQSLEQKLCGKLLPGIVACALIPQMGGWTLWNCQLIKSPPKKKQQKILMVDLFIKKTYLQLPDLTPLSPFFSTNTSKAFGLTGKCHRYFQQSGFPLIA